MVIQELSTSVAENFPVTVVLLNNGTLGMVRQMQKHYWNKRYSGVDLGPDPDFVTVAKGFGAKGIRVEKPGEIGEAIREAKESDRTTVVEIMVDPEIDIVPMLPANPKVPIVRGGCRF
jgi:acetolactate synthase-1/2/3 large subunit